MFPACSLYEFITHTKKGKVCCHLTINPSNVEVGPREGYREGPREAATELLSVGTSEVLTFCGAFATNVFAS